MTEREIESWARLVAEALMDLWEAYNDLKRPTRPATPCKRPKWPRPHVLARANETVVLYPCPDERGEIGDGESTWERVMTISPPEPGDGPVGSPEHVLRKKYSAERYYISNNNYAARGLIAHLGYSPRAIERLLANLRRETERFQRLRARREAQALHMLAREEKARQRLQAEAALRAFADL